MCVYGILSQFDVLEFDSINIVKKIVVRESTELFLLLIPTVLPAIFLTPIILFCFFFFAIILVSASSSFIPQVP